MSKRVSLGVFVFVFLLAGQAAPDKTEKGYAEYTFARVKFNMSNARRGINAEGQPPWLHDYPYSEDFFLGMVSEVTGIYTSLDAFEIVDLDSPDLFKYPFLYFSEPGFMDLTDDEIENLKQYFERGGFAMFDDFRGRDLLNLEDQMLRVFPDRRLEQLALSEAMFHSFYEIDSLEMLPPYGNTPPSFWGMKDDEGRVVLVANADNDFGEYWEYIDHGAEPLRPAVQSFQFGVNYLIYAMTH